jgi:hypothetical protein
VIKVASALNIKIMIPRKCARATHRDNQPLCSADEYLCRSIYIPYMDSFISSLQNRFSENNTPQYFLFTLHLLQLKNLDRERINVIQATYHIDNLENEAMSWFDLWSDQQHQQSEKRSVELINLLPSTQFFAGIRHTNLIALTIPASTCTVERSTMSNDRLSGKLCPFIICAAICVCIYSQDCARLVFTGSVPKT